MGEHLTREQIAALLDEPGAGGDGLAHLDVCSDCSGEFEAMSRMRMALSAMPDLPAPEGAWGRIRDAIPADRTGAPADASAVASADANRGGVRVAVAGRWLRLLPLTDGRWSPLLTAAAILVLFFAGLGVGRMVGPGTPGDSVASGADGVPGDSAGDPAGGNGIERGAGDEGVLLAAEYPEYLRSVAGLRSLREGGPSSEELATDPAAAAERLTRLDALIEASREALRSAPADPALNDFLFDVVDERASVAGQLDRTIRQASMEY